MEGESKAPRPFVAESRFLYQTTSWESIPKRQVQKYRKAKIWKGLSLNMYVSKTIANTNGKAALWFSITVYL